MSPATQDQERKVEKGATALPEPTLVLNDTVLAAPPESPEIPVECVAGSKKFIGKFRFKRPSIYETAAIGARAAELQSVYNPHTGLVERRQTDNQMHLFASRVATLECVVVGKPAWWDMERITEPDVIHAVFDAYSKWRAEFR